MIRNSLLIFILLLSCVATTNAQRRKKVVEKDVIAEAKAAMSVYDFDHAIDMLETKIEESKKARKKVSTINEEELLEVARKNRLMLSATEEITFIDSVVVRKEDLISNLKLSAESGKIDSYSNFFGVKDSMDCTVFINQLHNRVIYAEANKKNRLRLFQQELIGKEWKDAVMLQGLVDDESDDVNYPFMMDDGITLYFSAQREDGLGGYDIYRTRYDADEHSFLTAENVGMPFNSPANDYLMAIDEFYQLGFFVTDRNQAPGNVCVYYFIPNQTRRIYQEDIIGADALRNRALITSIKDTWTNSAIVQQAQARQKEMNGGTTGKNTFREFTFILNNKKTCYAISDFKSEEARKKVAEWHTTIQTYIKQKKELDALRLQYAAANTQHKNQLAPQIRILEANVEQAYTEAEELAKEVRRLELANS